MRSLLAALAAAVLAAVPTAAAEITYSFDFASSGVVSDRPAIGFGSDDLTVPSFDATLGTLTAIRLQGTADFQFRGTFTNLSPTPEGYAVDLRGEANAELFFLFATSCDNGCEYAGGWSTYDVEPGATEVTEEITSLYFDQTFLADVDFVPDDYNSNNGPLLDLSAGAYIVSWVELSDPPTADFRLSFENAYVGAFTVTYIYDEAAPSPVPEPGPLALVGLGLLALAQRRPRR